MVFESDGEYNCTLEPGFDVITLSIADDALRSAADGFGGSASIDCAGRTAAVIYPTPRALHQLRRQLVWMFDKPPAVPENQESQFGAAREELASVLISALSTDQASEIRLSGRQRKIIATRAREWLREQQMCAVTVPELCRAVGTSERTLRQVFADQFGVTPKAYLRAMRLNGAYRELLEASPLTLNVGTVALNWGFLSASQFTADYWNLFGELPSTTLRRSAG